MPKTRRSYLTESEKQAIVRDYNRSGLSVRAYCLKKKLAQGNLWRWLKKQEKEKSASLLEVLPNKKKEAPPVSICEVELEIAEGLILRVRRA